MPAVNAIEVAATINGVGPSSRANARRAFEFSIIASVFGVSHDARLECATVSGGSPS
jgi:hypothetical protein